MARIAERLPPHGADVVSFHIQAHCDNFLETIDRSLECRVEWERFAVSRGNHTTVVRPHPISVAFPEAVEASPNASPDRDREATRRGLGIDGGFLGVGVDRVDYSKGLSNRLYAFERLLTTHVPLRRRVRMLQIAVPSRCGIKAYDAIQSELSVLSQGEC